MTMWGKKKLRNNRAGEWSFLNFFFVSRRLEGVSGQIDERTFTHPGKNILQNISFDEKKAERNRFYSLSLSLSSCAKRAKKEKERKMMFHHHRGKKGAHKIEAFNDIKRDQKPREYQERRRRGASRSESFLRALGAGETFSSWFGNFYFDTGHLLFPSSGSFFFFSLPSLREGSSIYFLYFFPPTKRRI
jgi:hypothetical protein